MRSIPAVLLAVQALGCAARSVADHREAEVADERTGLLISNVHVFEAASGTFSEPMGMLVRDGRIHAVGPSHELPAPEEEIDARGGFALPGLWDSHVHLSFLSLDGPDSVRDTLEAFVRSGVLYVRDVGGSLDIMSAMRDRVDTGDVVGPAIFFSGPLAERPPLFWATYNEQLPGTTVPISSAAAVDSLVTAVARAGGSHVKVFGKWDVDLFRRLVRLARESDLEVVVDPGAPFFQDITIDTALATGVTSIEHASGAWQSVLPAALKATHDSLASDAERAALVAFVNRVIPLGTEALDLDALRSLGDRMVDAAAYFCPTLQVVEAWRVSPPSLPGYSPENADRHWNGFADAATRITQVLAERGVKLLIGQDGFAPGGTVREMEVLVAAGIPAADVLRAATLHPAQWLELDHQIGSLQVGMRADLVVVGEDPLRDMTALRTPVLVLQEGTVRPVSARPQDLPARRVVERAADLPRHTYPVTTVAALVEDDAQFAALAERVEADLITDLKTYEIADVATLRLHFGILSDLAVQRGDYELAAAWQDSIRAREEKPALRQLAGIVERSLAAASRAEGANFEVRFREFFRREVSALPYVEVQNELRTMKQGMDFIALPNAAAIGRNALELLVHDGRLSLEAVQRLVGMRAGLDRQLPVREAMVDVLDEVIAANEGVATPDIRAARDMSLEGRDGLTPVIVAIWDSGVDIDLFPGQVFVNPGEVAGNEQDDDANGFVDDVHGIAHDLNHDRAAGVLARITLSAGQRAEYAGYLKGSADIRWGVQSADAQTYRQKIASIPPAGIAAWIQGMNLYFDYVHGTHVAGIALRGNPAARVLVARNEEDNWKRVPQLVTLESERKRAREIRETVEYFRRHRVRVVNMSWALDPGFYADILQQNRAGGDTAERRRLAREMFDTVAAALRSAIEGAPEILFVAAAMNQDADNRFQELIPASFDLPNLTTVGAVDNAGNEAVFTSYGKVDVYASGVDVPSFVPGGQVAPISGTSMAAPQVVNLAAKLLALRPELSVAELRRIIIETADEKTTGEARSIRLLNQTAAVDMVTGR